MMILHRICRVLMEPWGWVYLHIFVPTLYQARDDKDVVSQRI